MNNFKTIILFQSQKVSWSTCNTDMIFSSHKFHDKLFGYYITYLKVDFKIFGYSSKFSKEIALRVTGITGNYSN